MCFYINGKWRVLVHGDPMFFKRNAFRHKLAPF